MPIILIFSFICAICRCVIFQKRDCRWWQGLIPIYSIYKFGKIHNARKLGIANAIIQPILYAVFFLCFAYEIYLLQNFSINVADGDFTQAFVIVPEQEATIAMISKYVLLAVAAVAFILWCLLAWKIIKVHERSAWWILLWGIIPVIPYIVYAVSNDVYIDGKLYTSKRVLKTRVSKK